MGLRRLALFTMSNLVLSGGAFAQTPPPPVDPDVSAVEDVTVVGAETRRTMEIYARRIGSGPMGRLSPRWNDQICVRVVNMDAAHAAFLRSRLATVARAIGLSPDASPECEPNITVYASDDPDTLADRLIEASPRSFRPARANVSLGDAALEAFRASDAPVRWWQVSIPLMADSGQLAMELGVNDPAPLSRSATVRNGSRLRGNVRDDLVGVTIILDLTKLGGVPFNAVSDYIAFVALAPADPRADTEGFDTVLNLFDRPGGGGLSLTDEDYLFALYSASRAPANAAIQTAEIADRMATERRRRETLQQQGAGQ
jgi:hypothetical protein